MKVSIIIASHNEGELLWRTVRSCLESVEGFPCEILVLDDASTDGSLELLRDRLDRYRSRRPRTPLPEVRIGEHRERQGVSYTKAVAARNARGDVLVFLDGHCRPWRGAIGRLRQDVAETGGRALFLPRIQHLDPDSWTFDREKVGYGFAMSLQHFECAWLPRERLRRIGRYYESPACIGCCLAVGRALYEDLGGFDLWMLEWGVEDIDFGFKAWLMGSDCLLDARATVGHRFQTSFKTYTVAEVSVLANKLRMARRHFTDEVWARWVDYQASVETDDVWSLAWKLYSEGSETVERERELLMASRPRDEFAYAERFGLDWPRRTEPSPRPLRIVT